MRVRLGLGLVLELGLVYVYSGLVHFDIVLISADRSGFRVRV
jgi:hypothetical protein